MHSNGIITTCCDIAAGLTVLGSLAGYLPEIAAGMAIIYYLFQFYRWLSARSLKK